jgi:hypothetical protein
MPKDHRAVTTVLGIEAKADDPDLCHHDSIIAHDKEEAEDPNIQDIHMAMKMINRDGSGMLYS